MEAQPYMSPRVRHTSPSHRVIHIKATMDLWWFSVYLAQLSPNVSQSSKTWWSHPESDMAEHQAEQFHYFIDTKIADRNQFYLHSYE